MEPKISQVEYIWLDGNTPQQLRSKTKIVKLKVAPSTVLNAAQILPQIPEWGFDGSSTNQAEGKFSDCKLKPVRVILDPLRGYPNLLVLCEVLYPDGSNHASNTRARLALLDKKYASEEAWAGIEQEYTLYVGQTPLGFAMQDNHPKPQGLDYCRQPYGRELVEAHTIACLQAGLAIDGTNAEVMPGQWEYQIGPVSPLECADQLWLARWLIERIVERYGWTVSLAPKPVLEGDWNGAGAHTNFSTKAMREPGGLEVIYAACEKLRKRRKQHIEVYGPDNDKRLTGMHETASIRDFTFGVSDRGASVRIPMGTANAGCGYLEDRRPAANMDPYLVLTALLETVCGKGFRK